MDYFCYISQNKVDQLLASFERGEQLEWSEEKSKSTEATGGLGISNVLSLLKGDLSYGRADMFQRNEKLKRTCVHKLNDVMKRLAPNISHFKWKNTPVETATLHYFLAARFHVSSIDNENLIATLRTESGNQSLLLDCSLKYFSDEPVEEGRFRPTSTNYRFFKEKMPILFETVFSLIHVEPNRFLGSPLFLKLTSVEGFTL